MDKKKCIIDKYNTVYCFDLYVILNPDKAIVDKKFRFREDDTSILDDKWNAYTAYTVIGAYEKDTDKDCIIIILNKLEDSVENANTFAHESFHAAVAILDSCYIKLTEDTNEVFAYLVGYLTGCVHKTAQEV